MSTTSGVSVTGFLRTETPVLFGESTFLRCFISPLRQWLRDGQEVPTTLSTVIQTSDPGFYQCVGLVAGRPETAITGDVSVTGNTGTITYLLNTCKYKYKHVPYYTVAPNFRGLKCHES